MTDRIAERIRSFAPNPTRAERALAAWLLSNLRSVPYETGATIAAKVGVSRMTVSRVIRAMGFEGLAGLKAELSRHMEPSWLVGDRYARFAADPAAGEFAARALQFEIRAMVTAYEQTSRPDWTDAVRLLTGADRVFVAGFQTVRGVAMDFAARLEYLRDGVRFLDGANGTYAEAFATRAERPCLLIADMRRYSRQPRLLARRARESGVPVILVVDAACHWAAELGDIVFHLQADVDLFWDSNAPMTALLNLMLQEVVRASDVAVGERIAQLQSLQEAFEVFDD